MSLAHERNVSSLDEPAEWVTKAEFHAEYPRASYAMMSREVDRGHISIKLDTDGKIRINRQEARIAFGFVDSGLFD